MNEAPKQTNKRILKQLLSVEEDRLRLEKLSYASLRKLTSLFELAMKVNAGELDTEQILPTMVRIEQKYHQRVSEAEHGHAAGDAAQ